MSKNIEMQVLGANGEYEQIYPVPAGHASSHSKEGNDPITPTDIGAMDKNIYDSQNRNTDIFTYTDSLLQNKVNTADFQSHANSKSNPHGVTAAQVGAAASVHNHSGDSLNPASIELIPSSSASHGGYIDFHYNGSTSDYTSRIIEDASGKLNITASDGLYVGGNKVYHAGNKPSPSDIGAAASSHNHSATNITSGTLAVARGGTGQTTVTPDVGTKGVRQIYAGTSDMTAGSTSLTTGVIYLVYE